MAPLPTPTERQQLRDDYVAGALVSTLRTRHSLTYEQFDWIMKEGGVVRRPKGKAKRILTDDQELEVVKRYQAGELIRALAIAYDVDRSVIKRVLNQRGIELHSVAVSNRKKRIDRASVCAFYKAGNSSVATGERFDITPATVCRILRAEGIEVRNSAKGVSGRRSPLTEQQIEQMVRVYAGGGSLTEAKDSVGSKTSTNQVRDILIGRGVKMRSSSEQNTEYLCRSDYFSAPLTPSAAYLLGWLYTDGYIREHTKQYIALELHNVDRCIVEHFRDQLCPTKPIYDTDRNTSIFVTHCKAIHADLVALGLHQAKSLTLEYPTWLTDELFPHFLRGVVEGDGFTCYTNDRFTVSVCGSAPFVHGLVTQIRDRLGVKMTRADKMGCSNYTTTSRDGSLILAATMYENAMMLCPRKFSNFARRTDDLHLNPRIPTELVQRCRSVVADCRKRFASIL